MDPLGDISGAEVIALFASCNELGYIFRPIH